MRSYLIIATLLLLVAAPAHADCTVNFQPGSGNSGQGQGGRPPSFSVDGCAPQGNNLNITQTQNTITQTQNFDNQIQNFNNRFTAIENQISANRHEARAGIAMAMAAAAAGVGGAAAGAGSGKIAAGLGVGDFQGTASLSAGIAYAVNKRFIVNGSFSVAPFSGQPSYGFMGGASLVLN